MHAANCCMACSGSVSLELLYHATPTVILYWVSRSAFFVQRLFRKVKYITLLNLLAGWDQGQGVEGLAVMGPLRCCCPAHGLRPQGATAGLSSSAEPPRHTTLLGKPAVAPMSSSDEVLFPEYLTCEDRSAEIAGHIVQWLSDDEKRAAKMAELAVQGEDRPQRGLGRAAE